MDGKIVEVSFGTARIYDQIIEITINEGVHFQAEDLQKLFELFDTYFPNKKFAYLSNRKNDYSLELTPSLYKSSYLNLTANAVLCYSDLSFQNANFEKEFYKSKPFKIFREHQEAMDWLKMQLECKSEDL
ncbi:hypothetical protein [Aequorivita capsosiphonis]|uniref:hypothetical protein n=1 Tax=Aequorivita capsosiphonis TaxID=487317 RepID=UPI00041AB939|nr:hypothetical protein [Aequorivita capsosiphonis]